MRRVDGGDERRNSLGLDSDRLNRLLDILDQRGSDADLKRIHVRWPFRNDSVSFRLIEGFGSRREFKVAARNLSNSGLSLIHNAYVHPSTECEVVLPTTDVGATQVLRGTVRRCQHVQGVVHEIGVEFVEKIDARQFLSMESLPAYYSLETIDPGKIEGTLLHIEDSAVDRRLFAHYLADTRVIIKSADSIADAKEKAKESFDLIVLDLQLSDGNGVEFVNWVRDNGIMTPIIVLTADSSIETQRSVAAVEINGFLTKPVDPGTLQRAVTEYLRVGDDGTRDDTTEQMGALASAFISEIGMFMDQIRECIKNEDAMTAYSIALRLKGTAPALGFDRLANVSDRAASALASSMSCAESSRQIDALLDACDRIKHRRAA